MIKALAYLRSSDKRRGEAIALYAAGALAWECEEEKAGMRLTAKALAVVEDIFSPNELIPYLDALFEMALQLDASADKVVTVIQNAQEEYQRDKCARRM